MNAMYCHLKSYSCTSSGTRILPKLQNLWQYPSTTANTGITLFLKALVVRSEWDVVHNTFSLIER